MLLLFPIGLVNLLGLPGIEGLFYAQILGGVLTGIGIALFMERFRKPRRLVGLGLGGAISINLCGGFVLLVWLIFGNWHFSTYGNLFLWILVAILLGLSLFELVGVVKRKDMP
jgi:hypothetical protein